MTNLPPNKDSIQSRLNRIRQSNTFQGTPSELSHQSKENTFGEKTPTLSLSSDMNDTEFSEMKEKFQMAMQNTGSPIKESKESKEKFTKFVFQANEMFQNYEKQLAFLRKKTSFFDIKDLIITKHDNNDNNDAISISFIPTKREKTLAQIKKLTEDEQLTLNDIKVGFTNKICDLLTENERLSQMIDKLTFDVINKLQEKIFQLDNMFKSESQEKQKLQKELDNMASVFAQNKKMKSDIIEKDEKIEKLESIKADVKRKNEDLENQIVELNNEITVNRETIENNNKVIEEKEDSINHLNLEIEEKEKVITEKSNVLKEKENEISLLYNDNIQWEEKYNLVAKEIENFKKWSLWDQNLIESYKKIESLEEEQKKDKDIIEKAQEDINKKEEEKKELDEKLTSEKEKNKKLSEENDNLMLVKLEYEKIKPQFEEYIKIANEYYSIKKDTNATIEKYENEIKENQRNFESELQNTKDSYEKKIENKDKEISQAKAEGEKKENELKEKLVKFETENKELNNSLEKKNQMLTNLKEVYESTIKKLKEKEDEIRKLEESSNTIKNTLSVSEVEVIAPKPVVKEESEPQKTASSSKVTSTFDQFAFTKTILIDYMFCLYLFETSTNIPTLTKMARSNINLYLSNVFNQRPLQSIYCELIEDIYFISFDLLIQKRLDKFQKESHSPNFYMINFEDFDRETLHQISKEILNKNFITKIKPPKTIEQIGKLFGQKYSQAFDFGEKLGDYLAKEIVPSVESRGFRQSQIVFEETISLVEELLHNLKNGKIIIDGKEIYSFDKYFNQLIERKETESSLKIFNSITSTDNIIHYIKSKTPNEVTIQNIEKSESQLRLIINGIYVYHPKISVLRLCGLGIHGTFFSDVVLNSFKKLRNLTGIDLSGNLLNDDDMKALCDYLRAAKTLTYINLSNNKITSTGGYYIADVLTKNSVLQTLILNDNEVNSNGLNSILNVLNNNNTTLKQFEIENNKLVAEDYSNIAEFFNFNPTLESLSLSRNKIDPLSANVMGVSIKKAKNLRVIKLNQTGLNDESSPQLLNSLYETKITEIQLDGNLFGEVGVIIMNKIKAAQSIKKIFLKNCGISSMFLTIIAQTIVASPNIELINLEQNPVKEADFRNFCDIIKESNPKILIKFTKSKLPEKAEAIACDLPNIIIE